MKNQHDVMKTIRKPMHVGQVAHTTPKGKKGYNRKQKHKKGWD